MPYCNAFDRFNSPCLSEISDGCDVCEQHTYFYGPQWFERFPFAPEPNSRMFYFSSSSKIKAIYTKAILEGRVKITPDVLRRIEDEEYVHHSGDFYALCCMRDGFDPLMSPRLFTQVVKEILHCHTSLVYDATRGDPYLLTRFLDPLLNTKFRSFGNMVCHILYCVYRLAPSNDVARNIDAPISLFQQIKSHPKFTSEFLWEHSDSEEKLMNMLSYSKADPPSVQWKVKEFFKNMRNLRQEAQETQRASFSEKRDEILAIAWNPDRFAKWCLDTEEVVRVLEYAKYGLTAHPATKENQRTIL